MSRNLLHIKRFDEFRQWAIDKGFEWRGGRDFYQLGQVCVDGKWHAIYQRNHMPEHVTVVTPLEPLVRRFIRETRTAANA